MNATERGKGEAQARPSAAVSGLCKWSYWALHICEWIEEVALKLQPIAEAIARAQDLREVRCYTEAFKSQNLRAIEAQALGAMVPLLGAQFRDRRSAEREAVSVLIKVVAAKTPLVISRQAQRLKRENQGGKNTEALFRTGLWRTREDLRISLNAASERDPQACARLQQAARKIIADELLPNPRGQKLSLETATHAVYLGILKEEGERWGYTDDVFKGYFADPRTAATCEAFKLYKISGKPAFNPKSAYNLVRAGAVR
jgi:hypothetical protein